MELATHDQSLTTPEFLAGGGEMGQRIREFGWESTPLGPVHSWPQSLRTCIRIMLASRQPIWIGWGKELIKLYNDPYKAIVGGKHPHALGQPASVVWKDIWRDIEPLLKTVMEKDEGTYVEAQLLIMERNGYPEETYYTFSYTPIPGDTGGTAGMICANTEDTERIIGERQLRTLSQLGKNLADCDSGLGIVENIIATLRDNPYDFPFALFYSVTDNNKLTLLAGTDLTGYEKHVSKEIALNGADAISDVLRSALSSRKASILENLQTQVGPMPRGAWGVSPDKLLAIPIFQPGAKELYGFLIVGVNPYRLMDEKYADFFSFISDQVATSFADLHALEEERMRAEALAEIDRAKTIFFSNISHEFRTPLTLLLGPIEEALEQSGQSAESKEKLQVAHRNALRLQKLVNTLLEFSRIEAGRLEGLFTQVDIASFTEDLVSTFRSATEKAGLKLRFHAEHIQSDVYVDVDMWERIVLNLVSNAFKYTQAGSIDVKVWEDAGNIHFSVADTGIGIPEDQLNKVFDRFHRVESTEARSKEGTGIGLALVKELVKLHGGNIEVASTPGKGTTFTVNIPTGKAHIPAGKIAKPAQKSGTSAHAASFLEEAMSWIPDKSGNGNTHAQNGEPAHEHSKRTYKVLLADDNADMRGYVSQLLSRQFDVITANDGESALAKMMSEKPDLLLSDIMMPRLDGFGLLKKVRNHPEIKYTPVIFLSARAGDEAKVEGLDAGADDYLVKPFSAKELVARVDANIKISRARVAAQKNLERIIMQCPVAMTILKGERHIIELANSKALELWGKDSGRVTGLPAMEAFPELVEQGFGKILDTVYTSGRPFVAYDTELTLVRNGRNDKMYLDIIYEPLKNADGIIEGIVGVAIDVTAQVQARMLIEAAEGKASLAIESANLGTYEIDFKANAITPSPRFNAIWGVEESLPRQEYIMRIHPDDRHIREAAHKEALSSGYVNYEARIVHADNTIHWIKVRGKVRYDENGAPSTLNGVVQDITEQKQFTEQLTSLVRQRTMELQRSNDDLMQFAHVASHDLKEPVRKIKTFAGRLENEYGSLLPEKGMQFLKKIQNATERMFSMIEGVLAYSTLNAVDEEMAPIDLNEIIENIKSDLEIVIQQKGATIIKDDLPAINGIPMLIYQLFYNLINNSLKFTKGETLPVIKITHATVQEPDGYCLKIVIEDNGIGFDNEYANTIFNTFTRLNAKDKFEGTGLGLALCKKIVDRHHGNIIAQGMVDKGAIFTILLPVSRSSL